MNAGIPGPVFMALIAIIFSYAVAWIAFQGVNGSTMVNIAINGIQIVALLFFSGAWRSRTASDIRRDRWVWRSTALR